MDDDSHELMTSSFDRELISLPLQSDWSVLLASAQPTSAAEIENCRKCLEHGSLGWQVAVPSAREFLRCIVFSHEKFTCLGQPVGSPTSSSPRSAAANVAVAEGSGQSALQPLLKKKVKRSRAWVTKP